MDRVTVIMRKTESGHRRQERDRKRAATLTLAAACLIVCGRTKRGSALSKPSKMPCYAWSIPAFTCKLGAKLAKVSGTVCASCYALTGCYLFKSTREAMARRFARWDAPMWVPAMIRVLTGLRDGSKRQNASFFRWFDSGDLQSPLHLENIVRVCRATPYMQHWLPTRERGFVKKYLKDGGTIPTNLAIRFSANVVDQHKHGNPVRGAFGLPVAAVVTDEPQPGTMLCPAYQQDGFCGDCRACWDPARSISYPYHVNGQTMGVNHD